jgi:hypothetical protein
VFFTPSKIERHFNTKFNRGSFGKTMGYHSEFSMLLRVYNVLGVLSPENERDGKTPIELQLFSK